MLIDCAKRNIKWKPLWIILILMGMFTVVISDSRFSVHIGLVLAEYCHLKLFTSGSFELNLALPVGAIVYFFIRKTLPPKTSPVDPVTEETPVPPAPPTAEISEQAETLSDDNGEP